MRFIELCRLLAEAQEMRLICGDYEIFGTADSISGLVSEAVDEFQVVGIETDKDTLKVWVKAHENA